MKNNVNRISFSEIDSIPKIIKDFLDENNPSFAHLRFSKDNFQDRIVRKSQIFSLEKRNVLVESISSQFDGTELSALQKENLANLRNENTFTITTGHQLNLFTGPAFFIYKIAQTIQTAHWLKKEFPNQNFVPIFWMATEDHDFEEINHFKTEKNLYQISAESGIAVGRIVLKDLQFITQFEKEFKDTVYGQQLISWIKEAYQKGRTLANATRILVNNIFSEYGLLIIDGDSVELKQQMKPIFEKELTEHWLYKTTISKVENLKKKYSKVQVNPREINLFYLGEKRERIEADGENFIFVDSGRKISKENLLSDLEKNPENFSPNAIMRPIYQETILPNLAYIGGNAEIAYWLELEEAFGDIKLPFPVLIPRNSMLYLSQKTLKKIENHHLKIRDFFGDFNKLIENKITQQQPISIQLEENEEAIKSAFGKLKDLAESSDKTFGNLVRAEEVRQLKSYERMKKRFLRAQKKKEFEAVEFYKRLYLELFPAETWQERVYNFSVFYSIEGGFWLQNCFKNINPEKSELIISEI